MAGYSLQIIFPFQTLKKVEMNEGAPFFGSTPISCDSVCFGEENILV
jgi:hypothetical protein